MPCALIALGVLTLLPARCALAADVASGVVTNATTTATITTTAATTTTSATTAATTAATTTTTTSATTSPSSPSSPATCGPPAAGATRCDVGPATLGNQAGSQVGVGNPINVINGNKYQREDDLPALPGVLGLEIVRHYNSRYSNANDRPGILGRGWKLSYETDLYVVGKTLQIIQADGSRIVFSRDPHNPSLCSTADPAHGRLRIDHTAHGDEYVWTWRSGRVLSFDSDGRLMQIAAPTGEFVSLLRDARGVLMQVTDPQGRQLRLQYPQRRSTVASGRFGGVAAISSPVGMFHYAYGSADQGKPIAFASLAARVETPSKQTPLRSSGDTSQRRLNLVRVGYPDDSARLYHYEDARRVNYLTGISVAGQAAPARIATYLYDSDGRAVLTVHGMPARLQTGADGRPLRPARLVEGTGIGQVTLDFSQPGVTTVANSLGQRSVYRHAIIAGENRLLEVRGAGCSQCGEMNLRYRYDRLGHLTDVDRLGDSGVPFRHTRTELDRLGRVLRVTDNGFISGRPAAPQLVLRYTYVADQITPILIERPSVVPGLMLQTRIAYGSTPLLQMLPVQITETGYTPGIDGRQNVQAIQRTQRYRYNAAAQRIETDGPLPNAPISPGPFNSDIVRTDYDPATRLARKIQAPDGTTTEILERDAAFHPSIIRSSDGTTVQTATIRSNWRGQPEQIRIVASLLKAGAADPTSTIDRIMRYRYDLEGRLTELSTPDGKTSRFRYDQAGRLRERLLPDGSRLTFERDTEGRTRAAAGFDAGIATATGAVNLAATRSTTGTVNTSATGNSASTSASPSASTSASTSASNSASTVTTIASEPDAAVTQHFAYDQQNRLSMISDALGMLQRQNYSDAGQLAEVRNAFGTTTRIDYDALGRMDTLTNAADTPDAARLQIAYDSHGAPTAVTDPIGVTTRQLFDDFGRKIAEFSPDRGIALYRYDSGGRLIARIDETHTTQRYRYDPAGRLIAMGVDQYPDVVRYRYLGRSLASVTTVAKDDPDLVVERTTYQSNAFGQVLAEHRWTAKVDAGSMKTARYTRKLAHPAGFSASPILPASQDKGQPDAEETVDHRRPVSTLPGLVFTTLYAYDDMGRLSQQTLPDGHKLAFQYGHGSDEPAAAFGSSELTAIRFDDRLVVGDIAQNTVSGLTGYVHGNGVREQITHDRRGRIIASHATAEATPSGMAWVTPWLRRIFGAVGNDVAQGRLIYGQSNVYDVANRLLQTHRDMPHTASTALRPVTSASTPGQPAGVESIPWQPAGVESTAGQSAGIVGTPSAAAAAAARAGPGRHATGMQPAPATSASTPTERAAVDRRVDGVDDHYSYDDLDRLVMSRPSDAPAIAYTYDRNGNRNTEIEGERHRAYHYSAGTNRLSAITETSVAHSQHQPSMLDVGAPKAPAQVAAVVDALWMYHPTGVPLAQWVLGSRGKGEHDSRTSTAHRTMYDSARRPIAVEAADGKPVARYFYNLQGERIAKTVYPAVETTRFRPDQKAAGRTSYSLYRNHRLSAEADDDGHITAHYIYLNGKPVAKIVMTSATGAARSAWTTIKAAWSVARMTGPDVDPDARQATIYAIHTDHLGTPQVVTDDAQAVVWQARTKAFGSTDVIYTAALHGTGERFDMNLRLPGQVYDPETGLSQNYYRDYDPHQGRYTTPDPLGLAGGMNPYAYGAGNPLNNTDPLGLYEEDIHYYMTYFLARAAGVDGRMAYLIATGDQYVDDNPTTYPMAPNYLTAAWDIVTDNADVQNRLASYHFTQTPADDKTTDPATRYIDPDNSQLQRLVAAADKAGELGSACAKAVMYGEYLHAFEDTFAHRRYDNQPIAINGGLGHAVYGHFPDHTYNETQGFGHDWNYNEDRSLEMEHEVFDKLSAAWGDGKSPTHTWAEIEPLLARAGGFNAIKEDGGNTSNFQGKSNKIDALNAQLAAWGYEFQAVDGSEQPLDLTTANKGQYRVEQGSQDRETFLKYKDGVADHKQGDTFQKNDPAFEGAILP